MNHDSAPGFETMLAITMAYRVFYHDLLITKLHHIDYENYTDGIHHPKDMLHGFQKI